jgi:chemotaxis protein CheC
MKDLRKLSSIELDALKELLFVAGANAGNVLSKIIGREIKIQSPEIAIIDISNIPSFIGDPKEIVIGIYSKLLGENFAGLLLIMPIKAAEEVYKLVTKNYEQISDEVLSVVGRSALMEVGNIIFAAIVNVLSRYIGRNLFISVPKLALDIPPAIVDVILSEIALESDCAIMIEVLMSDIGRQTNFKMFVIPDLEATEEILKALEKYILDKK